MSKCHRLLVLNREIAGKVEVASSFIGRDHMDIQESHASLSCQQLGVLYHILCYTLH